MIPKEAIHASHWILWWKRVVELREIERTKVIDIILDIIKRTSSSTLTFINLIGAVSTHITFLIQLVDANCTPRITAVTESLIVCNCTLGTFTLKRV